MKVIAPGAPSFAGDQRSNTSPSSARTRKPRLNAASNGPGAHRGSCGWRARSAAENTRLRHAGPQCPGSTSTGAARAAQALHCRYCTHTAPSHTVLPPPGNTRARPMGTTPAVPPSSETSALERKRCQARCVPPADVACQLCRLVTFRAVRKGIRLCTPVPQVVVRINYGKIRLEHGLGLPGHVAIESMTTTAMSQLAS